MKPSPKILKVQKELLRWFSEHRRNLPWRQTHDPYLIAVSEVMLQQTQVDRVIPKYITWRKRWPTTKSLARARLHQVVRQWSGLGYNSRAKRLRDAARMVMEQFHGHWPTAIEQLESLPGFGPYTARAVASFSYNADFATIDTNIRRVISRLMFGDQEITKHHIESMATRLLPKSASANWHAALMDFGSAVCTSRNPKCETCPLKSFCRAYPVITPRTKKRNSSSAPFQDSDRYWRGEIIRHFLKHGAWTHQALARSLQQKGQVDNQRVVRLLRAMIAEGLLKRRGNKYQFEQ